MALRLHLTPQAVDTLSHCSSSVRERLQYELGALSAEPARHPEARPTPGNAETVVLHAGFRAHYWLDSTRGLLNLLDLKAPAEAASRRL